jgi:hypothetical protein
MKSLKLLFIFLILSLIPDDFLATPLDDYVNKFDPNYEFKIINYTFKGEGYTLYCLNMTSQKWLSSKFKFTC